MITVNENQILLQSMEECEVLFKQLEVSKNVIYDVETSGLDWKRNHAVGHVIKCQGLPSYYVPVRHLGGGNIPGCRVPTEADSWKGDLHPFEKQLAKIARDKPRRWIGQNFGFDLKFAHRVGVEFYGDYEDTGINAPLIDENMRGFSLEKIALYMGVTEKVTEIYQYLADQFGGEPSKSQMSNWWRTDASVPIVIDYATGDGITTEEIWEKQQTILDEEDLRRVWQVECDLIRTIFRITRGGIRVDESELERCHEEFGSQAAALRAEWPEWFTKSSAPTQLKRYLEKYLDTWPRNAPTAAEMKKAYAENREAVGAFKFDEKSLKMVPEGRGIIAVRKFEHAQSAFTGPMRETHLFNGRVHCEFNQMKTDEYGTVSGRLSSSNPNMQQIPKRDKSISKPYRRCFLPEEGHIWFDNDYKQQEYVVFTDYTREPTLMAGYCADPPVDIHQSVADMLGVERDPTAKRMNLGMLYGMGISALAGHLGCSESEAREYQRLYHEKFPGSKNFLKNAEKRAKARGFVFTYLGRRRRFQDVRFAYKAGNAVIQGSSADITKQKMVEIDRYFESEGDIFRLMLQCHDSLSWSGPESHRHINNEAVRIMKSFGENDAITLGLPLGVDSGEGFNWSEATYGA